MLIRTVLLISLQVIHSLGAQNITADAKSKRGIYQVGDGSDYSVIPLHHMQRIPQIRGLTDASQVDITYKPNDEINHQYEIPEHHKISPNNYKAPEQTYSAQHQIPTYHHLNLPTHHQLQQIQSPYHIPLHPRVQAHLPLYGTNIRASTPEIKLPDYSDTFGGAPIIYGQSNGNLPSLKYVQQYPKPQFQPLLHQYKKYPNLQMRNLNLQSNPGIFKSQFYQPQVFDNPVVPQLQHFIPPVQSPFDAFTKPIPVTSAPIAKPTQKSKNDDDEDDDEDDDDERHVRKQVIKGEIHHESEDDEDDDEAFEKGYRDAARDFPEHDDDDDDHPRYNKYRSKYISDDDDDEYDDRRHRYRDPEGHYSQKHSKKESRTKSPKSKHRTEANEHYKSSKKYNTKSAPKTIRYSSKKQSRKNPKGEASTKSEVEYKPKYEFGFEPLKTSYVDSIKKSKESSSPVTTKKIHKENWYITKTKL